LLGLLDRSTELANAYRAQEVAARSGGGRRLLMTPLRVAAAYAEGALALSHFAMLAAASP
jgi:hypothetical protein